MTHTHDDHHAERAEFTPDADLQQLAADSAADAITFARNEFRIDLSWDDSSIFDVESILGTMHEQLEASRPTGEQIFHLSAIFGSYLGEVFRKNHGATWGLIVLGGEESAGMKAQKDGAALWPWRKCERRILNGPEDDVWTYYQALVREHGSGVIPQRSPRRNWWLRLLRA